LTLHGSLCRALWRLLLSLNGLIACIIRHPNPIVKRVAACFLHVFFFAVFCHPVVKNALFANSNAAFSISKAALSAPFFSASPFYGIMHSVKARGASGHPRGIEGASQMSHPKPSEKRKGLGAGIIAFGVV